MTTANRVHETSTTTGTGNLTLAGAVSNFQTFNNALGLNLPFTYWIDNESGLWETGIGHLSGTTTLVRDVINENSAGTLVAISFTGTLQVFIGDAAQSDVDNPAALNTSIAAIDTILPSNWMTGNGSSAAMFSNEIHYNPVYIPIDIELVGLSVSIISSSGTKARIGIYSGGSDGLPNTLLVSTGDISTTSTGIKSGSITHSLKSGWYWTAVLADGGPSLQRYNPNAGAFLGSPCGIFTNSTFTAANNFRHSISGGWTTLPTTATVSVGDDSNNSAFIVGFDR